MPWSGCATTSEFIELLNFGPGPMDISCYIVTNGNYAVTIPANTILQPGQYYILAGQNTLPQNCGNRDSAVTVNLNWSTCGCTDKAVPTTGDGFMQDGGNANEKMVLMDANGAVIDAASRQSTPSASVSITSSTASGGCNSRTFNLGSMGISYETIGSSTGIDNSFARRVDGDCGWVKTTDISAKAPNKTGSTSSASYTFSTLSASECSGSTGSISINVSANDVASLFPMTYTLGFDGDANGLFNASDSYTYGVDNSSPSIDINNLAYGRYRLTVGSSSGCNLSNFDFFIFNCYGVVLSYKINYLKYLGVKDDQNVFQYGITGIENIRQVVIEASEGDHFRAVASLNNTVSVTAGPLSFRTPLGSDQNFRLRITDHAGIVSYSSIVNIPAQKFSFQKIWPNPATNKVQFEFATEAQETASYTIRLMNSSVAQTGKLQLKKGVNTITIPTDNLTPGFYQLAILQAKSKQPIYFRFVKQ